MYIGPNTKYISTYLNIEDEQICAFDMLQRNYRME